MGSGVGPRIQGHDSLSVKVDAGNITSSTGSGATIRDLITNSTQSVTSATYATTGKVNYFVFAGSGNITGSNNVSISGANSRTISCWVILPAKQLNLLCVLVLMVQVQVGVLKHLLLFLL